jgi:hypothetical protein
MVVVLRFDHEIRGWRTCYIDRETRSAHNISVGKLPGKRQLRGPRHEWEDSIVIDLEE